MSNYYYHPQSSIKSAFQHDSAPYAESRRRFTCSGGRILRYRWLSVADSSFISQLS